MFNVKSIGPPYYGVAYYPEMWSTGVIEEDIKLMKEVGFNMIRMAEFAWSKMEPTEGVFEFEWLEAVIDRFYVEGFAVVLGTPSATPPYWLSNRYADMFIQKDDGRLMQHGERRHCCSNHPIYQEYSVRIAKEMAKKFADHPAVVGWQIDNEIGTTDRGCFCENCQSLFANHLESTYHDVKKLNDAWGLNQWSMAYPDFSSVAAPRSSSWHHPQLITEWFKFQSDSNMKFVHMQTDILRKQGVTVPIGTDMMPVMELNYPATVEKLDVVQFNHYDDKETLWSQAFWNDYLRLLKDRPFWHTETSTCWGGGTTYWQGYQEPGFCTVNTWFPFAMGGEACLYWLWRTHPTGHEILHGSVVNSAGRPLHTFDEVKQIANGLHQNGERLSNTKVAQSEVALHFSYEANATFRGQPLSDELDGARLYNRAMGTKFYRPLMQANIRCDVIDPSADVSQYKVVVSPLLPDVKESNLLEKMLDWVKAGGTWVVGPFSDIRNAYGAKFTHAPYGHLEELLGVYHKYQLPDKPKTFKAQFTNEYSDIISECSMVCDGLELRGATSVATYTDGPLAGLSAVATQKVGGGQIYLMGTALSPESFKQFMVKLCSDQDVQPTIDASENVFAVPRDDGSMFVLEVLNETGRVFLETPYVDLLTGAVISGEVKVKPYEVLYLAPN